MTDHIKSIQNKILAISNIGTPKKNWTLKTGSFSRIDSNLVIRVDITDPVDNSPKRYFIGDEEVPESPKEIPSGRLDSTVQAKFLHKILDNLNSEFITFSITDNNVLVIKGGIDELRVDSYIAPVYTADWSD